MIFKHSNFFRFLGIVLFIYILTRIDIAGTITAFKEINFAYYLMAVMFLAFWFLIRTLKWKKLINSVGGNIPANKLFEIMAKGIFWGVVTPGKLGEFWRAQYLAESGAVSKGSAFYTAFMDRLIDLLILGLVAVPGLFILYLRFNVEARGQFYILSFIAILFLSFVFLKKIGLRRLSKIFVKTDNFFNEFDNHFKALKPRLFFELLAYGFLYYLIVITVFYFTALALGIAVPFWYLFLIVAMVWLILILPISFFGLGAREAGFIYFFSIIGVSPSLAVAFSLLALFSNILLALPGAIIFLRQK